MKTALTFSCTGIDLHADIMETETPFDAIEVHPVAQVEPGVFEVCDEQQADMWSVYLHFPGAGLECIADCESRKAAEDLQTMLLLAGKLLIRK